MNEISKSEEEASNLKDFRNTTITGIFVVVPLGVTIWLGILAFIFLTDWAKAILDAMPIADAYKNFPAFSFVVRLFSLFLLLAFLYSVGHIAKYTIGKKIISYTDRLMMNMPMLKTVYATISQIMDTIKSSKTDIFSQAVLFEYPRQGIYSIGFVTNKNVSPKLSEHCGNKDLIAIFLPTTPNPTSGFFLIVPREDCIFLNIRIDEAMKIIISGGAIQPKNINSLLKATQTTQLGDKNGKNNASLSN